MTTSTPSFPAVGMRASAWRSALVVLALLLAWTLFLYWDTAVAMVSIWDRSGTFAHAFLVPPISLWLIWRQRAVLASMTPRAGPAALAPIALAGLLWLLGELASVNAATQFALTGLIVLAVPAVLGWRVAVAILFPLGFLFFSVPFGDFLLPTLMEWTADFTVLGLRLSGIPVFREGQLLIIPSGHWSVVEACSGVRYLIASVMVGTLFGYLNYRSNARRWMFVGVSFIVPVVANWLRAYMIVMLGHLSGNTIAVGVDHLIYGWVFFGIVMMLMFVIGMRWSEPDVVPAPIAHEKPANPRMDEATTRAPAWPSTVTWLAAALLVAIPQVIVQATTSSANIAPSQFVAPAALADGWSPAGAAPPALQPAFKSPSASFNTTYNKQQQVVGLYVGYYRNQGYDHKLVSSENVLVRSDDPVWSVTGSGKRPVSLDALDTVVSTANLRLAGVSSDGAQGRWVAWKVYWINGRLTSSDAVAKVHGAVGRLLGRGDDAAVIVLYAPQDQPGGADAALQGFAQANVSAIEALLRATRNR